MTTQKRKPKVGQYRDRIIGFERIRAGDLHAHPMNWRQHPKAQRDALKGVLKEIGWADVVLARRQADGQLQILDGHLRTELDPEANVPVVILDLDEEEAKKFLLTLDPLSAMAQPNQDILLNLLAGVEFQSKSVNAMLEALANGETQPLVDPSLKPDPGAELDRAEELLAKWKVEKGQIWLAGAHRLMCGDSTVIEDLHRLFGDAQADLVFTDPPYGVNYEGGRAKTNKLRDKLIGDESASLYKASLLALVRHLKLNAALYLWFAGTVGKPVYDAVEAVGFSVRAMIIWNKLDAHYGNFMAQYMQKHEPCLYCVRESPFWNGPTNEVTVWDVKQPSVNEYHPTMKPIELATRAITNSSSPRDIVADIFLGSGTTTVAAEQLGRICYGMEIEPKYVAVTLERLSKMGLQCRLE